ncbi:MAG: YhcH/YjgK/YiaL family protein [Endomicrobia bacterium]|nr:YhcH/YjgK/YiaL family protein [Endomicrobiia bacterium]
MIVDDFRNKALFINKFSILEKAFDFVLKSCGFTHAEEKRYEIDDNMYAVAGISLPKKSNEQKLEIHKKYVDLQYIIKGEDIIGWKSLYNCSDAPVEYNKEKDIAFLNDTPDFNIILNEGCFALFFPEDAHAPLCGNESVVKCVVKIKTELFLNE